MHRRFQVLSLNLTPFFGIVLANPAANVVWCPPSGWIRAQPKTAQPKNGVLWPRD